jgi:hypothetical protein
MAPAGEMWSVVTLSPTRTRQRAPITSCTLPGSRDTPAKYGGCLMYVESGCHSYWLPVGMSRLFQRSSPSNTEPYVRVNISVRSDSSTTDATSSAAGQMS